MDTVRCRVEDVSSVRKKMYVEIPGEVVTKEIENAYKELGRKASIKGFRPGKVPRKVLEQYYHQQVELDTLEKLLSDSYPKALEEVQLSPVARPVIADEEFKVGEALKYTATVDVRPRIEVADYLGLEIEKKDSGVSDDDVQAKMREIRNMHASIKALDDDRPVREGDVAVIDYEGSVDGKPVEGSKGTNYHLEVGSGLFNAEFEKQLIGLSKNAETEIEVTFSEGFANRSMAGKTMAFLVKVKDIKEKILPELNDAFAVDLGAGLKSLEELCEKVKEGMLEGRQKQAEADLRKQVIDQLIDRYDFELPESLVEAEIDAMVKEAHHNLERRGIPVESVGLSDKEMRDSFKPEAERRIRGELILEEIARKEDIRVEEEDIDEQFNKVAHKLNMDSDDAQRLRANSNLMQSLPDYILPEKTLNYLVKHAKLKLT